MPIYEYQCEQCGMIEEAIQKFSEKPLTKCVHCSGKLHKLISQSAFHLKGTGWYVTDYSGKNQSKKDNMADNSSKSENASDHSAKSDSNSTSSAAE